MMIQPAVIGTPPSTYLRRVCIRRKRSPVLNTVMPRGWRAQPPPLVRGDRFAPGFHRDHAAAIEAGRLIPGGMGIA